MCLCICLRPHVLSEGFLYVVNVLVHVSANSCSVRGVSSCGECVCTCLRTHVLGEGFLYVVSVLAHVSANSCSARGVSSCGECVCAYVCDLMF